ncbi:MAG TPA: DUF4097 family beta strand repeat-containing protein [Bryobacteraceae bacterium]|jgi:predicted membrane protein
MKRLMTLMGLTVTACALASAQATGDRVVVPARNTSHPRVVNANSTHGSITVKTYSGKDVIVETPSSSREGRHNNDQTVDGLRRIDLPSRGLVVEEEDNVINIRAGSSGPENLVITVPVDTSVHLRSTHGNVEADGVHGEVEVTTTNGQVSASNISGTVVASSTNGSVKVSMDRVDPGKPISFSTVNGSVDVTLPADLKANIKLRAVRGAIYSDFEMKLTGGQPATTNGGADGKFRVEFDRTVYGTINGGGTEASFYSVNGRITIRKKK